MRELHPRFCVKISKEVDTKSPTCATHRSPSGRTAENHISLTPLMTLTFLQRAELHRVHILYPKTKKTALQ